MKAHTAFALTALVAFPFAAAAVDLKDETDRFTGKRKIVATLDKPWKGITCYRPGLQWQATIPDATREPEALSFIGLLTYASCSEWTYLRCHNLSVLLDGKPFTFSVEPRHNGDVQGRTIMETVAAAFDPDDLEEIAAATKVEFKQCRYEWQLSPEELEVLGAFALKVKDVFPKNSVRAAAPDPAASPRCTPEQKAGLILLKLSPAQIAAACD